MPIEPKGMRRLDPSTNSLANDSEGQENPPTIEVVESVERLGSGTRHTPEGMLA
jgi:hypothetical protein